MVRGKDSCRICVSIEVRRRTGESCIYRYGVCEMTSRSIAGSWMSGVVVAVAAIGAMGASVQAQFVACWGGNYSGECNVPNGLGLVTSVAGGASHTIALKGGGTVACWGYNEQGVCNVPRGLAGVTIITGGSFHTIALAADLGTCSSSGTERTYLFQQSLPPSPLPAAGEVLSFSFTDLPVASASDWYNRIRIRASADLGLADEQLFYRMQGDAQWRVANIGVEGDCSSPADCGLLNPLGTVFLPGGTLTIEIFASPSVSAAVCPDGFIELALEFNALQDSDCNNNRRNDACDIVEGLLEDCNGNYWVDSCELARLPEQDCDNNGRLDCCDHADGALDCDIDGKLDVCQINADPTLDCDLDGRLDSCEFILDGAVDFNRNGVLDGCDIATGELEDCNSNGIADIVELSDPTNDVDHNYILDDCFGASPDLFVDGQVNAADLAIMLTLWGVFDARSDLNSDGVVGAQDLAMLLAAWGPIGLCGDGFADLGENCCNCPEDLGCGKGFDCFYGACVACPSGVCSPYGDDCDVIYGEAVPLEPFGYGLPCYGTNAPFSCASAFIGESRGGGFSMNMLSPSTAQPAVAFASISLIALLGIPKGLLRRLKQRIRR